MKCVPFLIQTIQLSLESTYCSSSGFKSATTTRTWSLGSPEERINPFEIISEVSSSKAKSSSKFPVNESITVHNSDQIEHPRIELTTGPTEQMQQNESLKSVGIPIKNDSTSL